jgi:hypothetical protein
MSVAWHECPTVLTRKGCKKQDKCFRNIHLHNYQFLVQEMNDWWIVTVVEKSGEVLLPSSVVITKDAGTHRSWFGTCTCGRQKVMGAPCEHMVIAVKMGRIAQLTDDNIMPYCWTTVQMRLQYPQELDFVAGMNMIILKNMGTPSPSQYYFPDIAGPRKTGIY